MIFNLIFLVTKALSDPTKSMLILTATTYLFFFEKIYLM